MFTGISKEICQQAWDMILPAIKDAADKQTINRLAGCIIVLDPTTRSHLHRFTELFSATIRSEKEDALYSGIAYAKAQVSFRTGLPSSQVQHDYPYLYKEEDTKWGGSTVGPGGLIVAFSGVEAVFDEMISEWMASAIRGLCRHEMTREDGVMNQEGSFIGR